MNALNTLDWVFLVVLLLSVALGLLRGLVYEVLSLMAWVAAFVLAQWLATDVAQYLPLTGFAEPVRYALGFVLIFVAVVFVGGLLAWLLKKAITVVGLRPIDRVLGGMFGLLRGVLILLALAVVVQTTALRSQVLWQQSAGAQVLAAVLLGLKPLLPQALVKFLP
ncbi:MAG: CvpA family protein [Burkholderiales bacterium]